MFNVSVLITDAFMETVETGVMRARAFWNQIMRATHDFTEPGVIFIDRVNAMNSLA